ncbi:MAG TPA: VUT family protein [Nautiliaceae bacterium]|nr:VUT family protein [Nautiliaceae bacterium]
MELGLFLLWVITTLLIVSVAMILGKKLGDFVFYTVFAMLILVSNLVASKILVIRVFDLNFILPAGIVVYSVTFLLTDAISEIYGKNTAKKTVLAGFIANLFAIPLIYITTLLPPADFNAEFAEKFNEVFKFVPQIIVASMLAYLVSQFHDVYAYHWYKKKTKGRFLWLRNNASTIISQLIDSVIFLSIAFYGIFSFDTIKNMIFFQWIAKIIIALIDTPFLYLIVYITRKL